MASCAKGTKDTKGTSRAGSAGSTGSTERTASTEHTASADTRISADNSPESSLPSKPSKPSKTSTPSKPTEPSKPSHAGPSYSHSLRTHNLRTESWSKQGPVGIVTRGTTGINRLRRSDRWTAHNPLIAAALRHSPDPLAVDVGYGASWTTTCEWATWLRTIRPDVRVTGVEIDPSRVFPDRDGVHFQLGGFEMAGLRPVLVRAFNVLRQYDVDDVHRAWRTMQDQLQSGGFIIEGTCDELGRRCSWILLDATGPLSLTLAWDPFTVERPSDLAERLPKVLIHRNIPGEPVYEYLRFLDSMWLRAAPFEVYGPRVRWREALRYAQAEGWPLEVPRRPLRDCIATVPWSVVSPG